MKDTGIDLYEIYRWPVEKKFVYAQHYAAFDKKQEEETDTPEMGDMDMPSTGGTPQSLRGKGPPSTSKPFANRKDVHPKLRGYNNLVNVQNPEQKAGKERVAEMTDKPELDPNPEAFDRKGDGIDATFIEDDG